MGYVSFFSANQPIQRKTMIIEKSHYRLDEAAELLECKSTDLIHLAAKEEMLVLVGVPDDIEFRTYDAGADRTETPALLVPQLLALSSSQCLKIEVNSKTEQSDFRTGYLIDQYGRLQQVMPSYGGRFHLEHGWAFWRTYKGPYIRKIELISERLFVLGDDVRRLLAAKPQPVSNIKPKKQLAPAKVVPEENISNNEKQSEKPLVSATVIDAQQKAVRVDQPIVQFKSEAGSNFPLTILRLPEISKRTGLSRSTIYEKLDSKSPRFDPSFPQRIRLSEKSVGWSEKEIDDWLSSRQVLKS